MNLAIKKQHSLIQIILLGCVSLSPFIGSTVEAADSTRFAAQLPLPRSLPQSIPNIPIKPPSPKKLDQLKVKSPFAKLSAEAIEQARVESIAQDPLNLVTAKLPILDTSGALAFNEVAVENGFRAIEREWLVVVNQAQLQQLKKLPIKILKQKHYSRFGLQVVQFKVPTALDSKTALSHHLSAEIISQLDRNHVYSPQSQNLNVNQNESQNQAQAQTQQQALEKSHTVSADSVRPSKNYLCKTQLSIGMIDTEIDTSHPALSQQKIIRKNFVTDPVKQPKAHGTVIAGIFKAQSDQVNGLLPNAKLYAASAFYSRNDYSQGASLAYLIDALAWLSDSQVKVINMSLTGPHNQVLQQVISALNQQDIIIVAAAGNQGPAAAPLYPAAYKNVIAVSAVDNKKQIYRWANQGDYIDFVARGVRVTSLNINGAFATESGTSLAAPIVSSAALCLVDKLKQSKALDFKNLKAQLTAMSEDLGNKGHDSVFGYGLIE